MSHEATPAPRPLAVAQLTWAALLARWIEFARSAAALPRDADGKRLRACVPDLITLQAVWFALGELDQLPADEKSLGLDRAQVLIDRHAGAILERFARDGVPPLMAELVEDARTRLRQAAAGELMS